MNTSLDRDEYEINQSSLQAPPLDLDNLTMDLSLPLNHPTNIPSFFHFLIQHLSFSTYLSSTSLLTLQRLNHQFFHLITPLFYTKLKIDLNDSRNPATSISPYNFFPNPKPPFSKYKSLALGYVQDLEWINCHSSQCKAFLSLSDNINTTMTTTTTRTTSTSTSTIVDVKVKVDGNGGLILPRLSNCRITLPAGRYKSWCGIDNLVSTDIKTKEAIRCGVLRRLRADKVIVEIESFGRIDLFGRKDLFEHDELVCRIGYVGEDATLLREKEWPITSNNKDQNQDQDGSTDQRDETSKQIEDFGVESEQEQVITQSNDLESQTIPREFIQSLDILPSLDVNNTVPNLTMIFLSPPRNRIARKLTSEDQRTDAQRISHHLLALASILCSTKSERTFEKVRLVNIGVLLFHKHGIKREESDLRNMQDEIKNKLVRLIKIRVGLGLVDGIMSKVEFVLLDDYLKEEKKRTEQVRLRAKAGQKNVRLLY
ncbi:hypothetical protein I203_107306 [Kwoniella mangroviensis CBS 8507]|uniref:hypothetical protein n=1 Tax=Kwoniella mangroviensis CBS 8507 TaxID=1296122 RepID=UPI003051B5B1